jgi:hypothetical protein
MLVKAYVTAVAGLAKFYQCSPDRLRPEQIRTYPHHLLVEQRLAWSSCNQAAAGLKFFYTKTLGWDVLHLDLPSWCGATRRSLPPRSTSRSPYTSCFKASLGLCPGVSGTSWAIAHINALSAGAMATTTWLGFFPRALNCRERWHKRTWGFHPTPWMGLGTFSRRSWRCRLAVAGER